MDLNDIWQEHKGWILACLVGLVLFVVGQGLISSTYDTSVAENQIRRSRLALGKSPFYQATARKEALDEAERLGKALALARSRCVFTPGSDFDLAGKPDASLHYLDRSSELRRRFQERMETANVDYRASSLGLPPNPPVEREEYQHYLIGADLVTTALDRLLVASETVLRARPESRGLTAIEKLRIEPRRAVTGRNSRRKNERREAALGEQVVASLRLRADAPTLLAFLESLPAEGARRPLLLRTIDAAVVGLPGEPLLVDLELVALVAKPAPAEEEG